MSAPDNDNFHDNAGVSSSQAAASSQELVARIKSEREMPLDQIEASQSTIIRPREPIGRLDFLLVKLGDSV